MKRKWHIDSIALILILSLFGGIAMASGSSNSDTKQSITGASSNAENADSDTSSDSKGEENAPETTIDEQVLVDENGLKITATEYVYDSIWGEGVKLLIENTSDSDYQIACDALIVNDYMITDLFSSEITAGRSANETMYLYNSELEDAGIENVGKIEIDFRVFDPETFETVFDPDMVTIETSNYAAMDTDIDVDGFELYNSDGIRIVGQYVDDSIWGTAVLLYVENNTDRNIVVTCDTMAINNFMVNGYFYSDVYSGKKAFDTITVLSSDLEENNITTIENIAVDFHISDANTYETIVDTGEIEFSVT